MVSQDCQDILNSGNTTSGVYTIQNGEESMEVYCDMKIPGEGYIVSTLVSDFHV